MFVCVETQKERETERKCGAFVLQETQSNSIIYKNVFTRHARKGASTFSFVE